MFINIDSSSEPQHYKKLIFPCGEMHIDLDTTWIEGNFIHVAFTFRKNEDIIELLLVCDAIKRAGAILNKLTIPYVPFARQDRINTNGECFSLAVFASLINGLNAREVLVTDPHSDVVAALINNCRIFPQHEVFVGWLDGKSDFYLVSPDGGALKKIYKLAERVNCLGVIECSKNRNVKTGEITGVKVYADGRPAEGKDCYIVDDICDGGRTFIEVAKELKKLNPRKIVLMVTHGFFTKGLSVFDGLIDEIITKEGKIK
jgi:ribose-phosphate pyrophosphokinase